MKSEDIDAYVLGLKRTVSLWLFAFLILVLIVYGVVVQSVFIVGAAQGYLLTVIALVSVTVVFSLAMLVIGWPVRQMSLTMHVQVDGVENKPQKPEKEVKTSGQ